jgi:hypothetical protein
MVDTKDKVVFADYDDDSVMGHVPVEPALLKRLEQERTDFRLSSPTPSVLQALSSQSLSLYDLGVQSGIEWGHYYLNEGRNPYQSLSYPHFVRMAKLVDCKRSHLYRSYAEGWISGWSAATNLFV